MNNEQYITAQRNRIDRLQVQLTGGPPEPTERDILIERHYQLCRLRDQHLAGREPASVTEEIARVERLLADG